MINKTEYEELCYKKGFKYICGIDEVGRGPIAGPVVTAAVILPKDYKNQEIDDSKKIKFNKRETLAKEIKDVALHYSIVEISPSEIDRINILNATKKGMLRCIENLNINPDFLLTDYVHLNVDIPQLNLKKGDSLSQSIAAASIIAKVHRDNLMIDYSKRFPEYDFENNMGYGTKKHLEALNKNGYTKIHRKTFEPVKSMIQGSLF